jgi:hypothetical protein
MKREPLAWLLALGLGAVVVWQGFQLQRLEDALREQPRQQASQPPRDSGRREADPYLQKQVKNTLTKRQSQFRECYTSFLTTEPETKSGRVVLDWQIQPDGDVLRAEVVRSDFPEATLGECLRDEAAKLTFPPPPSRAARYVEHTFRFDFQPQD